ncbi:MAG: hypothetical protein IKZ10_03385 [Akkermansia sp.]|nr:hypothetical protein [Akkermansia sp.]
MNIESVEQSMLFWCAHPALRCLRAATFSHAHSHGGNVTLTALSELNKKNLRVNNVVLIATPHFKIKLKNGNSEFLYAQKSAISAIESNKPKINNKDYKAYDRYEDDIKEREYYKSIENMSKKN